MVIEKLGRYVIVEEIGQGAMGVVYKAVDPLIDRTVAIKTINLDLSKEELTNFEHRFQREVQSAGKLNHPNIVTIYDVGRTEGVAYMAMEFLEGKELREILDSGVVLPIEKVIHIASQVADGLAFAHEHGTVHRDIKPANVMVMKNGLVKITDFGIAQVSNASRTHAGMVLGSPKYMSPEQVVGQTVDGRSDIFSLGVMLYEMLTGKTPFSGDNISTIMYQILNDEPAPPRSLNQSIPDSVSHIVLRALAKHPDKRYQTAKEMARDLKRYKTLDISAQPEPAKQMDRRRQPRDNLGETTQIMPSLAMAGEQTVVIDAAPGESWWNPQRFLLYGAIPAMILTFIVVVAWGKLRQQSAPAAATVEVVRAAPETRVETPEPAPPAAEVAIRATAPAVGQPIRDAATKPQEKDKPKPKKEAVTIAPVTKQAVASTGAKAVVAGEGQVILSIVPWGEVFIDGKRQGVTPPLRELTVPAGKHTILIVNETFKPYSQTLEVAPNTTHKIKYKFSN